VWAPEKGGRGPDSEGGGGKKVDDVVGYMATCTVRVAENSGLI